MKTMKDLDRLALRCPLLYAHLSAWKNGDYPSFEAMLINMVCDVAESNQILLEQAEKAYWKFPPSFFVLDQTKLK